MIPRLINGQSTQYRYVHLLSYDSIVPINNEKFRSSAGTGTLYNKLYNMGDNR